jgi:hypothetical protein
MNKNAFEQLIILGIRGGNTRDLFSALFGGTNEDYEAFMFQAFASKILAEQKLDHNPEPTSDQPESKPDKE